MDFNAKIEQQERVKEFRNYVYFKALNLGEELMPNDVAEIMLKADRSGKFKDILFNGFNNMFGKMLILFDVYESCGFEFPNKNLTRENEQEYF